MKKVLALVVAFALCFTALAGCFVTSAELAPSIAVSDATAPAEGGAVSVTVEGNLTGSEQYVQLLEIVVPSDLTNVAIAGGVAYPADDWTYVATTNTDGDTVLKLVDIFDEAFTFTVDATAPAYAAENNAFDITATAQFADFDATSSEDIVTATATGTVTVAEPAPEHTCDFSGDPVIVQPTKDAEGSKTYTCTCGATKVETIARPVLDTEVTINTPAIAVQDTLGIGYTIRKTNVPAKYASLEFVSYADKYNGARYIYTTNEAPIKRNDTSSFYAATYTGIAMFELDLPVSTYIKYYDADGIYVAYSETITKSPVELLKARYDMANTSEKSKRMTSDMLNLGAAAQAHFGAAANDTNCDLYKATPVNADTKYLEYATTGDITDLNVISDPIAWNAENTEVNSSNLTIKASLNYAGTPTLGFLITKDAAHNSDDYTLDVSYDVVLPSAFAGTRSVEVGAGRDVNWTPVGTSNKMITYAFDQMTLADSDQVITAVLKYQGVEVCTYTVTMETLIKDKLDTASGTSLVLSDALARFGASARNNFS